MTNLNLNYFNYINIIRKYLNIEPLTHRLKLAGTKRSAVKLSFPCHLVQTSQQSPAF